MQSHLNLNRFELDMHSRKLHKNVNKSDWASYVNSFAPEANYNPQTNSIGLYCDVLILLVLHLQKNSCNSSS